MTATAIATDLQSVIEKKIESAKGSGSVIVTGWQFVSATAKMSAFATDLMSVIAFGFGSTTASVKMSAIATASAKTSMSVSRWESVTVRTSALAWENTAS